MAEPVTMEHVPSGVDAGARQVLADGLSLRGRRPERIVDLHARPLRTYSSHPITRLVATLADGSQLPVVFKRLQPHPDRDVGREVLVYERVLVPGVEAPTLYASRRDETRGHYWLFLEDVGSLRLEWCDVEEWAHAFRWLARMHAAYAGRLAELEGLGCLDVHGSSYYRRLALAATRSLCDHHAVAAADRLERLCDRWLGAAAAFLSRQPRTLVHGDLSCHNVMVQRDKIRAVDWEWAGLGPAAWDVAKLLAGWGPRKGRLLDTYLAEHGRRGGSPGDRDRVVVAVAQCEAMQILWYLRWWTDACRDPVALDRMLDRVERRWRRLRAGA